MDTVFYTSFERAVVDLERAVCRDRSHVVLATTSAGPSRAALAQVLEERFSGSLRPLEIPIPTASHDEIRARIVDRLGEDPSAISEERLAGLLREIAASGSALLLLIRDADSMPSETLGWLGRLAAESGRGLRLVLVVTVKGESKGDLIPGLIAALGAGAQKVVLETPGEWAGGSVSGAAGSRDASLADWAHPLRSRVETLRSLTVRPRDPRQSRWRGHAALAAAVALVAFGVHHLAAVPLAPEFAAARDSAALKVGRAAVTPEQVERAAESGLAEGAEALDAGNTELPDGLAVATGPELAATVATGEVVPKLAPVGSSAGAIVPFATGKPHEAAPAPSRLSRETGFSPLPEPAKPAPGVEPAPVQPVAAVSLGVAAGAPVRPEEPSLARTARAFGTAPGSDSSPVSPVAPVSRDEAPATVAAVVRVSVNARPWATIEVDGRNVGITPLADLEMSPGPHRFQARLSDGRVLERTVHVDEFRDRVSFP